MRSVILVNQNDKWWSWETVVALWTPNRCQGSFIVMSMILQTGCLYLGRMVSIYVLLYHHPQLYGKYHVSSNSNEMMAVGTEQNILYWLTIVYEYVGIWFFDIGSVINEMPSHIVLFWYVLTPAYQHDSRLAKMHHICCWASWGVINLSLKCQ